MKVGSQLRPALVRVVQSFICVGATVLLSEFVKIGDMLQPEFRQ